MAERSIRQASKGQSPASRSLSVLQSKILKRTAQVRFQRRPYQSRFPILFRKAMLNSTYLQVPRLHESPNQQKMRKETPPATIVPLLDNYCSASDLEDGSHSHTADSNQLRAPRMRCVLGRQTRTQCHCIVLSPCARVNSPARSLQLHSPGAESLMQWHCVLVCRYKNAAHSWCPELI